MVMLTLSSAIAGTAVAAIAAASVIASVAFLLIFYSSYFVPLSRMWAFLCLCLHSSTALLTCQAVIIIFLLLKYFLLELYDYASFVLCIMSIMFFLNFI